MKHWIKTTLGIGLAIGLWQVSADARFLDFKKQKTIFHTLHLQRSYCRIKYTEVLFSVQGSGAKYPFRILCAICNSYALYIGVTYYSK